MSQDETFYKYFNDDNFKDFRHSFTQKAPEGESYQDVFDRVATFFNSIVDRNADQIVIVAHQVSLDVSLCI